jgi:hypothetical protein
LGDWSMNERERERDSITKAKKKLGNFWDFLFVLGDWSMNVREGLYYKSKKKLGKFWDFLFVLGWLVNECLTKEGKKNLEHLMHPSWLGRWLIETTTTIGLVTLPLPQNSCWGE